MGQAEQFSLLKNVLPFHARGNAFIVGDQQNRFIFQPFQNCIHDFLCRLRIQGRRRFIKDEDAGMTAQEYHDQILLMAAVTAVACAAAVIALAAVIRLQLKLRKENEDYFY